MASEYTQNGTFFNKISAENPTIYKLSRAFTLKKPLFTKLNRKFTLKAFQMALDCCLRGNRSAPRSKESERSHFENLGTTKAQGPRSSIEDQPIWPTWRTSARHYSCFSTVAYFQKQCSATHPWRCFQREPLGYGCEIFPTIQRPPSTER